MMTFYYFIDKNDIKQMGTYTYKIEKFHLLLLPERPWASKCKQEQPGIRQKFEAFIGLKWASPMQGVEPKTEI